MSEVERGPKRRDENRREIGSSNNMLGSDRWLTCKFAIPQVDVLSSPKQSDGPQPGWNSDYSCTNSDVIKAAEEKGISIDRYTRGGQVVFEAVEISGDGYTNDVITRHNLEQVCGKCPFYQPKNS
jgi:hypothetical protein